MKIQATSFVLSILTVLSATIYGADVTADNLTVQQDATIAGAAGFGTVYTGVGTSATVSDGFRFSVAQATQQVPVEVTHSSWVEGHYEYQSFTVEDYGTVPAGHWEDQYSYGIIGQEYVSPRYDEYGEIIEQGYYVDVWGNVLTGQFWVDDSYWGVIGTHNETASVWVEGYTNTWTQSEIQSQYGSPRLEFKATRSDANWVWQVPTAGGTAKDVLVVWEGGLRIPSVDTNRMMALTADNLTQSQTVQNTDGSVSTTYTKADAGEVKANKITTNAAEGTEEEYTTKMHPRHLRLTKETRNGTTSTTMQTQIGANYAHFGGVVKVEGNLNVKGVLRVLPAGDLDMGAFTNGAQP